MNEGVTLVTGASSDIGRSLVTALLESGATVAAHCHAHPERLRDLAGQGGRGRIEVFEADFRDANGPAALAAAVLAFGCPDRIVHLPGLKLRYERFGKVDWARAQDDFDVQVRSAALLLGALLPELVKQQRTGKVVILLSSVTLGAPPKYVTGYAVVKHALLGLTRSLAAEFADKGITVNALSPSMVDTQFLAEIPAKAVEISAAQNPMRRNAGVGDIVPAIQFLLSSGADYITGANIPVTGGSVL